MCHHRLLFDIMTQGMIILNKRGPHPYLPQQSRAQPRPRAMFNERELLGLAGMMQPSMGRHPDGEGFHPGEQMRPLAYMPEVTLDSERCLNSFGLSSFGRARHDAI